MIVPFMADENTWKKVLGPCLWSEARQCKLSLSQPWKQSFSLSLHPIACSVITQRFTSLSSRLVYWGLFPPQSLSLCWSVAQEIILQRLNPCYTPFSYVKQKHFEESKNYVTKAQSHLISSHLNQNEEHREPTEQNVSCCDVMRWFSLFEVPCCTNTPSVTVLPLICQLSSLNISVTSVEFGLVLQCEAPFSVIWRAVSFPVLSLTAVPSYSLPLTGLDTCSSHFRCSLFSTM